MSPELADFLAGASILSITLSAILYLIGLYKLEKKGYHFWGCVLIGASICHLLTVGLGPLTLGVALLLPDNKENKTHG